VDVAEEADALAVFTECAGEMLPSGEVADFGFEEASDGEEEFLDLLRGDLCEEVGLVFESVFGGGEPDFAMRECGGGVMTGGYFVEVFAPSVVEAAEFDEFVAHDVGVWGEALFGGLEGVADDLLPVFVVEGDDFKAASVFFCDEGGDFDVFFGGAMGHYILVAVAVDLDIEEGGGEARFFEEVNHDRTVHPPRY